jgi:hypothetical protein
VLSDWTIKHIIQDTTMSLKVTFLSFCIFATLRVSGVLCSSSRFNLLHGQSLALTTHSFVKANSCPCSKLIPEDGRSTPETSRVAEIKNLSKVTSSWLLIDIVIRRTEPKIL